MMGVRFIVCNGGSSRIHRPPYKNFWIERKYAECVTNEDCKEYGICLNLMLMGVETPRLAFVLQLF